MSALWLLWQDLGVVKTLKVGTPWPVDAEAAILGVLTLGRSDPRLYDAALTWWWHYEDELDVMRLDGLAKRCTPEVRSQLAAWVSTLSSIRASRWRRLAGSGGTDPRVLFLRDDGGESPVFGERDETFRRAGWERGPLPNDESWIRSGACSASVLRRTSRSVFGHGARAEVVTALVSNAETSTTRIAEDAGYSTSAVQKVLWGLQEASLIEWDRRRGGTGRVREAGALKELFVGLVPGHDFRAVPFSALQYRDWPRFFIGLSHLHSACEELVASGSDGYEAESRMRDALELTLSEWHPIDTAPSSESLELGTAVVLQRVREFVRTYSEAPRPNAAV